MFSGSTSLVPAGSTEFWSTLKTLKMLLKASAFKVSKYLLRFVFKRNVFSSMLEPYGPRPPLRQPLRQVIEAIQPLLSTFVSPGSAK